MKKPLTTLAVLLALASPLAVKAAVNEGVSYEGNDSNTDIQGERHETSLSEKIDSPQANGEYYVANGAIKVTTDSENKLASVEVVDPTKAVLTHVHVKASDGFRCYESTDGFGASGLWGNTNKHGKIQEISHITVFYHEVHEPGFVAPGVVIDHDHETDYRFKVENPQPGQTYIGDYEKIKVTISEDGKTYKVEILDKCWDLEYIHDTEHRDVPDGTGVVTDLPVNDTIIIYVNEKDICKPDVIPPVTPQEPVVPEQPEPEEPKVPEFLPETGLQGLAYGVVGLGLAGLGIKISKKRK